MKASRYRQRSGEPDGGHFFLRTHQCLSRTVRDSAALLAATENPNNQTNYPAVGLVEGPGKRRLRIAVTSENAFGEAPVPAVKQVLEDTMKLCEALGHHVVDVPNPIKGEVLVMDGSSDLNAWIGTMADTAADKNVSLSIQINLNVAVPPNFHKPI